jgi:hypothetical protein
MMRKMLKVRMKAIIGTVVVHSSWKILLNISWVIMLRFLFAEYVTADGLGDGGGFCDEVIWDAELSEGFAKVFEDGIEVAIIKAIIIDELLVGGPHVFTGIRGKASEGEG